MLTYSREHIPEYQSTNLDELVASVVDLKGHEADKQEISLSFHPSSDEVTAEVDPMGIYRAVLNLVTNALDACEPGAAIHVSVRSLDAQQVLIEVTDQGCGMDETTRESIFQPFYSLKGAQGTGLGLPVTHQKIVAEHAGRIEVEAAPGQGSTFRIYLPRRHLPGHRTTSS